jgi:hypothetical protein
MVQCAMMPSTHEQLFLKQWFEEYFTMAGHSQPNEAHVSKLHSMHEKDAYDAYKLYCKTKNEPYLASQTFCNAWNTLWPGYQPRPFSGITGHCPSCSNIEQAKDQYSDSEVRKLIQIAENIHRGGFYFLERDGYEKVIYEITMQNTTNRSKMSLVIDIPDQSVCHCPYIPKDDFDGPLEQVVVGAKSHGRGIKLYRTPGNVTKSANLTAHIILCEIEDFMKDNNNIPPEEIYIQIDGGAENSNKLIVIVCELLVVKRLARLIVLSRLPVGHTHSDIDQVFGVMNGAVSQHKAIYTLEQWKEVVEGAFKRENMKLKVVDVTIVPNYHEFIDNIHHNFSNFAKG